MSLPSPSLPLSCKPTLSHSPTQEDNDVDDIEDEEDDIGEDDETEDFLDVQQGLLIGEELLMKQYSLKGEDGTRVRKTKAAP